MMSPKKGNRTESEEGEGESNNICIVKKKKQLLQPLVCLVDSNKKKSFFLNSESSGLTVWKINELL